MRRETTSLREVRAGVFLAAGRVERSCEGQVSARVLRVEPHRLSELREGTGPIAVAELPLSDAQRERGGLRVRLAPVQAIALRPRGVRGLVVPLLLENLREAQV